MHLNGNVERNIVIVSLSHGWSQGKLRAFRYKIKIKIQFWFVIFKSQRHINEVSSTAVSEFVTRADNTIIGLGCDKKGSTKTPVIIKVDWVLTLNAWDCCRNNLHFRVLFWPPEPAVWELFGFCWFASVCWIERGHFEFQTFPWLLDEKRFLIAKGILSISNTEKNHLGQISTKVEPLCEILKGFSAVSSYSDPTQWKAVFEHFKSRAQLIILILQSNCCMFKINVKVHALKDKTVAPH